MASNFDVLREEFDRMSSNDQFRLGMAGMFRQAQNAKSTPMPSPSPSRSGYNSIGNSGDMSQTDLSDDTITRMASAVSTKVYRVKILDAFSDIVNPMATTLESLWNEDKMHKNRIHHESTLYYQGIIGAISNLGENNKSNFMRAIYLNYQTFLRHPMWSTFSALNDYVVKPLARLGMGAMFGFGKKSDTDRIVDAIKQQTEFMQTGKIATPSNMQKLFSQGALGFLFKGITSDISSLLGMGKAKSSSPMEQSLEASKQLIFINTSILKAVSEVELAGRSSSSRVISNINAANDEIVEEIRRTGTGNVVSIGSMSVSNRDNIDRQIRQTEDNQTDTISLYERFMEEQRRTNEELEEHNRRERRRSLLGFLGGIGLKGGALAAIIGGALSSMSPVIRDAIFDGFKFVGGLAGNILSSAASSMRPENLGMLIGGALMFTPMGRTLGMIVAGMSFLTKTLNDWVISKSPNAKDQIDAANEKLNWEFGSSFDSYRAMDTRFLMTRERKLNSLLERRHEIEQSITQEKNNRDGAERSDELIRLNEELSTLENQIKHIDTFDGVSGRISPTALGAALRVGGNGSSGGSTISRLLNFVGQHESRGNYNALVYGNNTPKEANLTDMTIAEVLQYQSGMRQRGHASSAVGKYQFIQGTLQDAITNTGMDTDELFSSKNQDKLAEFLLERRGLNDFQQGNLSPSAFAGNLAKEWASLPLPNGQSAYEGIAGNRAGVGYGEFSSVLNGMTMNQNSVAGMPSSSGEEMGFLDSLMSSIMPSEQVSSSSSPSTAVISDNSIRQLAQVFQSAVERMPSGGNHAIDLTGIGD